MLRIKSISRDFRGIGRMCLACMLSLWLVSASASGGRADPVGYGTARTVAQNKVQHHLSLYGNWNGSAAPAVVGGRALEHQGVILGYNFQVHPSGHILVAVDDAFSPVLLYSTRSAFDAARMTDPNSVESWIIPELHHNTLTMEALRRASDGALRFTAAGGPQVKINSAWQFLTATRSNPDSETGLADLQRDVTRAATVGPLLSTIWGQRSPYYLQTPAGDTCDHTLTGCVATAWAQLARYWQWPIQGSGSHSYQWDGQTLSADFGAETYDWGNMPDDLTASSTQAQKDAVSQLMYHMGVAANMNYGCSSSGSSAWADQKLDLYFGYQSGMVRRHRSSYTASQWIGLFKQEFDADPPRPVVMAIFETGGGGHEVVADGYQSDGTDLIHINMGWDGYYDAFYNITSNFQTQAYTWEADSQTIVTNIAPDNAPPDVDAGSDQSVDEGSEVQLNGSATDPEGVGISSHTWTQTGGAAVNLTDSGSFSPTFTAPEVDGETALVFQLRAVDNNRAFAVDTVTITVADLDNSQDPSPPTDQDDTPTSNSRGGGGSSGGCFVSSLMP